MSQNIVDIAFDAVELAEIDSALSVLDDKFSRLIALEPQRRKRLHKMGTKSEAFCRLAIEIMSGNPGILPVRFDLAAVQRDLAAWDALRPRRIRMLRLFERMMDTEMALGSDMMANSVEAYAFLRVSGKSAGLDALRKQLAVRFKGKRSRSEVSDVPEDSPEESASAEA